MHPYLRPLSLRENGGGRPKKILPEALGGKPGVKPLPVGLIVATSYREGAPWRPRRLLPGRAVMALLSHTLSTRSKPKRTLSTLRQVVVEALALKGMRGEAAETAQNLLTRLSDEVGGGS